MYQNHLLLHTPPDETRLWRYMNLSQLLHLACERSIYFAKVRELEDKWEGALPSAIDEAITATPEFSSLTEHTTRELALDLLKSSLKQQQHFYAVSCWHQNEVESIAMWRLYTAGNYGVAIQTTVGRLKSCVHQERRDIFIAEVQACESAAASRVAQQFGLAASTVRAIDQRYLARWGETRRKPALRQLGVDEIFLGKKQKFVTVVSNLDTGEPLWFGQERKKETLDEFFRMQLSAFQRSAVRAACVDMWDPFRQSIEEWLPQCRIVYDKFRVRREKALNHSGCKSHPGTGSLHPVAIGAAVEVTKLLEPPV